ncbi:flagellar export chaperone FliS [Aneurinibacillus uraniidurans]|uniref:flagellar export chaperone FliS n=1 Tax=Aneurinibacillus uraniidurans TaxID=2966586 RepID=UPI00234A30C5|nr:flagellar export chaperone FliS [Aneurinibacillus sp. B1]WCN38152.1 flagellar export chaperone FliS [Aneurinibacillus sp. B1]
MERVVTLENVEISDIHDRPELITSLLYKKLLQKIDEAIVCIPKKDFAKANSALQLSCDIIERLGAGIKYEAGTLADHLEMLYQYCFDRVVKANFTKDISILQEVKDMINQLDEAWTTAMEQEKDNPQAGAVQLKKPAALNPYLKKEIEQEVFERAQENPKSL